MSPQTDVFRLTVRQSNSMPVIPTGELPATLLSVLEDAANDPTPTGVTFEIVAETEYEYAVHLYGGPIKAPSREHAEETIRKYGGVLYRRPVGEWVPVEDDDV